MKQIIIALAFALGTIVSSYAGDSFPTIPSGSDADTPSEQQILPPGAVDGQPKKEIDYSKHPIIQFDPKDWIQIGTNDTEKETYWLQISSLDPTADQFIMVGMIQYEKDRIIQGVGTNVRRVFSEAVVVCFNRTVLPLRDVYTTEDFHLVSFHRHAVPQGMMLLDDVPMFKLYPDAKTKICPQK
jgi:hypothetical protein